jgi:hypothetical protein
LQNWTDRRFEGHFGSPPPQLGERNYIFFYDDPKVSDSGFGTGLASLVAALNTDLDWLREHTRYLQRATEWDRGGRPANRLLSGDDIAEAKAWVARRPKGAPSPRPCISTSSARADQQNLTIQTDTAPIENPPLPRPKPSLLDATDQTPAVLISAFRHQHGPVRKCPCNRCGADAVRGLRRQGRRRGRRRHP